MSLLDLREMVRCTIQGQIPDVIKVATHDGRFDVESIRNYATQAPCVVVSVLDVPEITLEGGQLVGDVQWAAFLITKDVGRTKRGESMLALLETCLTVIRPEQNWGSSDTHQIDRLRANNLFSTRIDKMGLCLWAVVWRQKLDLTVFDFNSLNDFLTYNVKYDLEGSADSATEAEDTVELAGPED